jgi:hypothetical protein
LSSKKVPALVCSRCGEAYVTPEVSEKIDEVKKEYRAGKLLARPLAAVEIVAQALFGHDLSLRTMAVS